MNSSKTYFWIKLKNDFFDLPTIDWLADQPNGYAYIVLYQKLCLLTANNGGELTRKVGEMIVPYNVKKIAEITRFDFDTVAIAMELYKTLGLIYEQNDGVLQLTGIEDMVGSESKWAEKKRAQRQKKADLEGQKEDNVPLLSGDNVRQEIRDKSLEIRDKSLEIRDKSIESEIDASPAVLPPAPRIPYEKIGEMYNQICKSFPRCTSLSDARKKAIKARFASGYTIEDFQREFEKAEASSFLKGQNNRNWMASFDWLLKDSNMAKVLDGNYDDHHPGTSPAKKSDLDDLF